MSFVRPILGMALLACAFLPGTGNACARSFHADQTAIRESRFAYSHLHHTSMLWLDATTLQHVGASHRLMD